MSLQLIVAIPYLDLPRPEKDVLRVLADFANDEGENCWPSIATVAWKAEYSVRQVQRIMARLREAQIVVPVKRRDSEGSPTIYRINLSAAPKREPMPRRNRGVKPGDILSPPPVTQLCHPPGDTTMSPKPLVEPVDPKDTPLPPAGAGEGVGVEGREQPSQPPAPPPSVEASAPRGRSGEDDADFCAAWAAYPKRATDSRKAAYRAWKARLREGVPPQAMLDGVARYTAYLDRHHKRQFAKGCAVFFGPDEHWKLEYADEPEDAAGVGAAPEDWVDTAAEDAERRRQEAEREAAQQRQQAEWVEQMRVRWLAAPQDVRERLTAEAQAKHEAIRGRPLYDEAVRSTRRNLFAAEIGMLQPEGCR